MKNILVVAVLAVAVFCSAGVVNAQTSATYDQLTQQLIQALTQLITQLQQEIATILAQRAATAPATCAPNWQCAWGSCTNGYQSQIAKDSNNCGLSSSGANIACPALAKACSTSPQCTTDNDCPEVTGCISSTGAYSSNCMSHEKCISSKCTLVQAALAASCSASPSSAKVNQQVTWTSTVSGGSGGYTYQWSGAVSGTYSIVSASFAIPGTMPATLIVKDSSGKSATTRCSVTIVPGTTISQLTNGACGSANGQTFPIAPTANLCSAGTASSVSNPESVGGWYWTCAGLNGGTTTHCTATIGSIQSGTSTAINSRFPTIVVASPNGGETFAIGQSIPVTWNMNYTNMADSINIQLVSSGANVFHSDYLRGFSGSNQFVIPANLTTASGFYKVCVVDNPGEGNNTGESASDCSDNFFTVGNPVVVTPPVSTTPSITVISPNGGEAFAVNQPITVTWNMNYSNVGASIDIQIAKDTGYSDTMANAYTSQYIKGVSGLNQYTFPANIFADPAQGAGPGQYKVCVVDNPGAGGNTGKDASDCGNNYFFLIAAQ